MEIQKTIILGFYSYDLYKPFPNATDDDRLKYFPKKTNPHGCFLLTLMEYFQQFTISFDKINFVTIYDPNIYLSNGTLIGLEKK